MVAFGSSMIRWKLLVAWHEHGRGDSIGGVGIKGREGCFDQGIIVISFVIAMVGLLAGYKL